MNQENCPACGRLMETFKTETGREIHTCENSTVGRRHLAVVLFYADTDGERRQVDPTRIETTAPGAEIA